MHFEAFGLISLAMKNVRKALFFRDLMRIFPNAKVLLTIRDNPEAWYKSVKETIYIEIGLRDQFETGYFIYFFKY